MEITQYQWNDKNRAELANLWHMSHGFAEDKTTYGRKLWTSAAFNKANPTCSSTAAYKELDKQRAWREL